MLDLQAYDVRCEGKMMVYRSVVCFFTCLFLVCCTASNPQKKTPDLQLLTPEATPLVFPMLLNGTKKGEDTYRFHLPNKPFKKLSLTVELLQPDSDHAPAQLKLVGMKDKSSQKGFFKIWISDEDCDGSYFPSILYYYEKSIFTEELWSDVVFWGRDLKLVIDKVDDRYIVSVGGFKKSIKLASPPGFFELEAFSGLVKIKEIKFDE